MEISVVIPTRNREKELNECLESISKQSRLPEEVLIIDSSDVKININYFNLNIIHYYTKKGLELQRNFGIKKSKGEIIVFSDDDTIWDKDYLKEIERVFIEKDNVGGVTGNPTQKEISYKKKILLGIYKIIPQLFLLTCVGDGKFRKSGRPKTLSGNLKDITPCEFLYGFSMAFKKSIIEQYMFDENLKGYVWNEDDDIAYRISRNYQNYFNPNARILHKQTASAREDNYEKYKKKIEYHYYLFNKNMPKRIDYKLAFWWSVIGLILEELIADTIKRKINLEVIKGLWKGLYIIIYYNINDTETKNSSK